MFFNLKVLFYTLVFAGLLEIFSFYENTFAFILIFLAAFSFFAERKVGKAYLFAIIPFIFSFSALALLFLIDNQTERQIFIVIASFFFYFLYLAISRIKSYAKDQTARGMLSASLCTTIFFFYAASYGFYINFSVPIWSLMLAFLIVTTFVSFQYFDIINKDKKKTFSYSLALGMIMAEIAWMINFWPFGYLTTGVIALIFYYVLWNLVETFFLDKLSQKRMISNLIFFGILIGLILASSKWMPVV